MIPQPREIAVNELPYRLLADRRALPNEPAVYFVLGPDEEILYIGKAGSLQRRWAGHHRLPDFERIPVVRIAWFSVSDANLLDAVEEALIEYFAPPMNGGKRRKGRPSNLPRRGSDPDRVMHLICGNQESEWLLQAISRRRGRLSKSGLVRLLLQEEAARLGIPVEAPPEEKEAALVR